MSLAAKTRSVRIAVLTAVAVGCLTSLPLLAADETAAAAREVARKYADAVVTVKVTVKMRWVAEGRQEDESESTGEVNGTVLDASGLLVCSLSQVDPSQRMGEMEEDDGYQFESEITGLKILRPDGTEIPAKVVLRDKDLDLAFIRPAEPLVEPMASVDLAASSAPQVLDTIVLLSRMGRVGSRTGTIAVDRISAIIEKPRTLYVAGMGAYVSGLGCPVFALDGKLVGLTFVRSAPGAEPGERGAMPIILPAPQIAEVAAQAPKA